MDRADLGKCHMLDRGRRPHLVGDGFEPAEECVSGMRERVERAAPPDQAVTEVVGSVGQAMVANGGMQSGDEVAGQGIVVIEPGREQERRLRIDHLPDRAAPSLRREEPREMSFERRDFLQLRDPVPELRRCVLVEVDDPVELRGCLGCHRGQAVVLEQTEASLEPARLVTDRQFTPRRRQIEARHDDMGEIEGLVRRSHRSACLLTTTGRHDGNIGPRLATGLGRGAPYTSRSLVRRPQ